MEAVQIPWRDPVDSPKRINVRVGDVYQFIIGASTRAGHNHLPGHLLVVTKRTKETPYGEIGPRGYNWCCLTQHSTSVWSTLESCIERGMLRLVHKGR